MSAATVIATIDSAKVAQQLIDELLEAGFKDQDVEILDGDEDELVAEIVERGFGQGDARGYAKAVSRGKSLVAARAAPGKAEKAAAIMERYEAAEGESSQQSKARRCRRSRRSSRSASARSPAAGCGSPPASARRRSRRPSPCARKRSRSSAGRRTAS